VRNLLEGSYIEMPTALVCTFCNVATDVLKDRAAPIIMGGELATYDINEERPTRTVISETSVDSTA
jgi:hypothetical protein